MLSKKNISAVLGIFFVALFLWYFMNNFEDFDVLAEANLVYILLVAVGHVSVIYTNGLIIKWMLEPYKKQMPTKDSFYVSLISSIGNFFLPVGTGTGMRAYHLKSKYDLSYRDFITTLSGNYIIVFFINSLMGLIALLILNQGLDNQNTGVSNIVLSSVFFIIFLTTLVLATMGLPTALINIFSKTSGRIGQVLGGVLNGWNTIVQRRELMMKLILAAAMNLLSSILVAFASIKAIGLTTSLWPLVLYSSLGSISLLINITPGAIGIREGLYIFSSSALGFSTAEVLLIAVVDRVTRFTVLGISWVALKLSRSRLLPAKSI